MNKFCETEQLSGVNSLKFCVHDMVGAQTRLWHAIYGKIIMARVTGHTRTIRCKLFPRIPITPVIWCSWQQLFAVDDGTNRMRNLQRLQRGNCEAAIHENAQQWAPEWVSTENGGFHSVLCHFKRMDNINWVSLFLLSNDLNWLARMTRALPFISIQELELFFQTLLLHTWHHPV